MLRNRVYVGDFVYNRNSQGKYSEYRDGKVTVSDVATRRNRRNEEKDWIVKTNNQPAIIDRELFAKVQEVLTANQKRTSPNKEDCHRFLLPRLLVCQHCGSFMSGRFLHGRAVYICGMYRRLGKRACSRNSIREDYVLDRIIKAIQIQFLNPEKLDALRAEMIQKATEEQAPDGKLGLLNERLKVLTREIEQGQRNVLLVPQGLVPELSRMLGQWIAERDRLTAEIKEIESGRKLQNVEEVVKAAEKHL